MSVEGPFLEARGVWKSFPDPGQSGMSPALEGVSCAATAGEFVVVVGPSGGGKSTLLRLLAGLIRPDRGEVLFRGSPLTAPTREIGFVFQRANLMPWRTVYGNVMLPLDIGGVERGPAQARAQRWLDLVGLQGYGDAYPAQLSGGMQQRVALARALIHEPGVLLLDEPFGALDALTRERMNIELIRIWDVRKPAVVMVTHSIAEAVLLADRVLVMSSRPGRMRAEFTIPLARPRLPGIEMDARFLEMVARIRQEIRD